MNYIQTKEESHEYWPCLLYTSVKAKQAAAEEMAVASGVKYLMYAGSQVVSTHILDGDSASM